MRPPWLSKTERKKKKKHTLILLERKDQSFASFVPEKEREKKNPSGGGKPQEVVWEAS